MATMVAEPTMHDVPPRRPGCVARRRIARRALRRTLRLRRAVDAHLLPAVVPVAPAVARERELFRPPGRRRASRVPRLPAVRPARRCARIGRRAGDRTRARFSRRAHRSHGVTRRARGARGRQHVAPAALVQANRRTLAQGVSGRASRAELQVAAARRRHGEPRDVRSRLRIEQPRVRADRCAARHDAGIVSSRRTRRAHSVHDCRRADRPRARGDDRSRRVRRGVGRDERRRRARAASGFPERDDRAQRRRARDVGAAPCSIAFAIRITRADATFRSTSTARRSSGSSGRRCRKFRAASAERIARSREAIGRPTATRAVARACATNRVAIVIPCHRVVREDGDLAGYKWGVERKRKLLDEEAG